MVDLSPAVDDDAAAYVCDPAGNGNFDVYAGADYPVCIDE